MTITEGLHQKCRELESQIHWLRAERALLRAGLLVLALATLAGWLS